jgi:hypothetical protein
VARWNDAPTSGFYVVTRWSVMYRPCVHSGRGATSPRHCRAGLVPDAGRTESFWRTTTAGQSGSPDWNAIPDAIRLSGLGRRYKVARGMPIFSGVHRTGKSTTDFYLIFAP